MKQNLEWRHWQSIIAFFLVSILFGSIPPVTKLTVSFLDPIVILSVRYIIAFCLFIPLMIKTVLNIRANQALIPTLSIVVSNTTDLNNTLSNLLQNEPITELTINKILLRDGLVLGILTFGIHLGLSFGVQTISANRASFLFGLCIIFVFIADVIYRKWFSSRIFVAVILAFSGSSLMSWEQSYEPLIGTLWILGAVSCEATILILLEDIATRHNLILLSLFRLGVATTLALILAIGKFPHQLTIIEANWIPLFYLGVVTAATTWLVIFALQTLPAVEAALIQTLEPVFGTIISSLLLQEMFGWRGLIGCGLILTGTILAILNSLNELADKTIYLTSEESKL